MQNIHILHLFSLIFILMFLQQTFIFYLDHSRMMTHIDLVSRADLLTRVHTYEFAICELLLPTNSEDVPWRKVCRCRS